MEVQKPKSIKIIGLLVSIFSGLIILSNAMGALVFSLMGFGGTQNRQEEFSEFNIIEFLFENYSFMCLFMVAIGIFYLIGGLNIRKYKLWAKRLVTFLSAFLIVVIWGLMILIASMVNGFDLQFFGIAAMITAVFWSTPLGLLVWFLNKKDIKKHFV